MAICLEYVRVAAKVGVNGLLQPVYVWLHVFGLCGILSIHPSTQCFSSVPLYDSTISLSSFSHLVNLSMLFGSKSISVTELISASLLAFESLGLILIMIEQSLNVAERR